MASRPFLGMNLRLLCICCSAAVCHTLCCRTRAPADLCACMPAPLGMPQMHFLRGLHLGSFFAHMRTPCVHPWHASHAGHTGGESRLLFRTHAPTKCAPLACLNCASCGDCTWASSSHTRARHVCTLGMPSHAGHAGGVPGWLRGSQGGAGGGKAGRGPVQVPHPLQRLVRRPPSPPLITRLGDDC